MTITPTALLSLPIITTGTESGTWGDVVDNGLTSYMDIAIAGGLAVSITTADVTLTKTAGTSTVTNIGATTAQYAILNISGAKTAAHNLNLPVTSKYYLINNAGTGGFLLTVRGVTPTTGVTLIDGEHTIVAWNGTDYVKVVAGVISTGTNQIAIGNSALKSCTGIGNVAIGNNALQTAVGANFNTAVGYLALQASTATNVTAVGASALTANTTGVSNVAVGSNALAANTTGSANTAVGFNALAASTGVSNVAVGANALASNTSGTNNVAVGAQAFQQNTTGTYNVAVGYLTLSSNISGNYNTTIGNGAGYLATGSGNVIVGTYTSAGADSPAFNVQANNDRVVMGSTSVTNAYIQVAWTVVSDARDKTDFADVPHGLDFVSKLQPTAYRYKENRDATEGHGPVRYGFKAQDVLELEGDTPVIVDADDMDKLRFNDQALLAVLVNAIKELKAKFDEYKAAHP
jgi:hypothetical protein